MGRFPAALLAAGLLGGLALVSVGPAAGGAPAVGVGVALTRRRGRP